jgi:1-acyl-sn-glycerol-3-phosphate acyltransferase
MSQQPPIPYPRKRVIRTVARVLGRAGFALLSRIRVTGMENLPRTGPLILVGNHVAVLEAAMMALYAPYFAEIIAAGEIPLDPRYEPFVRLYGYIPIRRGEMDRDALDAAVGVLKQGGVVGMFPEGGIWESSAKKPRTGVAWLSAQTNAPVVPIGFGGIDGALGAALKFKRPRLTMNVGLPLPPVNVDVPGKSRKEALEDAATLIMARISDLIAEEDKKRWNRIRDERFELQFAVKDANGAVVTLPENLAFTRPEMLAKFFHRPLLLDVLARNLKLPVTALQRLDTTHDPKALGDALDVALNYLAKDNPQFLSYRFGYEEGGAMKDNLAQLRDIARWAERGGYELHIVPIRRYRKLGSDAEIVEDKPGALPAL